MRSSRTLDQPGRGRLCTVVFANDISGISQIPDRKFSQALTQSSEQYEKLYPSLAGATMIMNLPFVLQAFVGLFTPPPAHVASTSRLTGDFRTGPPQVRSGPYLGKLKDLTPLAGGASRGRCFSASSSGYGKSPRVRLRVLCV